jgi:uncharacterized protein YbjT (DUF2867 family)
VRENAPKKVMMSGNRVLVTGAPGNVGTDVVRELVAMGCVVRVGAFDVALARQVLGESVEVVRFDFLDAATFAAAFEGVERMFLVRPPALGDAERQIAPAIRAAVTAGVQHIVFLSLQGVEQNRFTPHYKIEQIIEGLGVAYTFLRASFFMQNLSTTHRDEIRDESVIYLPVGDAKTSFIDARDIAAVAARALTEDGHARRKYTLTGAEALGYDVVAAKLSAVLGRPIRYARPNVLAFVVRHLRAGKALPYVLVMALLYTLTRTGNAKDVTGEVERVLGRPPRSFDQFAHDYRAVWG